MKIEGFPQKKNLLIRRLISLTGENAVYNGAPSFSYDIGAYRILRDGSILILEENADTEILDILLRENLLKNNSDLTQEVKKDSEIPSEQADRIMPNRDESAKSSEKKKFDEAIVIREKVVGVKTMINLLNMLYSKQNILNKMVNSPRAFWISENLIYDLAYERPKTFYGLMEVIDPSDCRESLIRGICFSQGAVIFDGFPETNDFVLRKTYEKLAKSMYLYSEKMKWISSKRQDVENEKYYCRNWLNRIGLGGEENKTFRDILLKNLRGNGSYRTEEQFLAQMARRKTNNKKNG